jgi:LysR family transcriptional regulator, glycine cleavage system transcriptional activator
MVVASHLKSLQALELAIRTGSLTSAAEQMSITTAAVGQRIKTLEDFLGFELVERGRSGLQATEVLAGALPHLAAAFNELGLASEMLDLQRTNEIHIAANSDWVDLWLAPRLSQFRSAYPNIRFCINGEGDAPMRIGRSDIEITFGVPRGTVDCDLLFRDYLVPVSSPENAERIGRLPHNECLEGFPLLHLDFYKDDPAAINWPLWITAHGARKSALTRGIRYQRIAPGLHAVASDAGLMICGLALISEQIDAGDFITPFPRRLGAWTTHAFEARYRPHAIRRKQVERFRDWLFAESEKTREWLEDLVMLESR